MLHPCLPLALCRQVCDEAFTDREADTVCRQLGLPTPGQVRAAAAAAGAAAQHGNGVLHARAVPACAAISHLRFRFTASQAFGASYWGPGEGTTWLDGAYCTAWEDRLQVGQQGQRLRSSSGGSGIDAAARWGGPATALKHAVAGFKQRRATCCCTGLHQQRLGHRLAPLRPFHHCGREVRRAPRCAGTIKHAAKRFA